MGIPSVIAILVIAVECGLSLVRAGRGKVQKIFTKTKRRGFRYIFGLLSELRVHAVQGVPETAGQLPQWLILRVPIHFGVVESRLVAATGRAKVIVAQGAPLRMWERAPLC
jgi:hypothetical protein